MLFYSGGLQKPVDIYGETGLEKSDKVRKKRTNAGLWGRREGGNSWEGWEIVTKEVEFQLKYARISKNLEEFGSISKFCVQKS